MMIGVGWYDAFDAYFAACQQFWNEQHDGCW